ncbi:palmdelphin [Genypterus blacodes]|uniref:palmdelphin n=1 Tax=Genypterus blacodes TaxID=154954 RepID=UPI003F775D14
MEEADLLKERLQAITDKRRIQEDIAKKRRQIEEEKLKLQYIKKKALREQWLMEGLSQQSEEEQEAMRLQALDEQQQSDELQSKIHRIEKEVETLETEELKISANEEVVLKRLKEVERTPEDIIKELNADLQIATFAMEISVEHDIRTGKNQVVSTATVTPETAKERGVKVYDDGRKSVYALHPDGHKMQSGSAGMTPRDVDELLRQATDKKVPSEVLYHQPVYSAPYTGSSRPSTPRTARQTPTPCCSPLETKSSSSDESQILRVESQFSQELEGQETLNKSPSPCFFQQDTTANGGAQRIETKSHFPNQTKQRFFPFGVGNLQGLANQCTDMSSPSPAALVSVKARSEGMLTPIQPVYVSPDSHSPSQLFHSDNAASPASTCPRYSPFYPESTASLNPINNLQEDLETEPVTMIFMGYQNAEDEEEEDIHAELVIVGYSDDDVEGEDLKTENRSEPLSYHPEGYKSKVFQPKVGVAKVTSCRDLIEGTKCDDVLPHKPTFIHKPGERSPCLQGRGMDESTSTSSINLEEMKLCTTGR